MVTEQPTQKFTDLPFREQLAIVNLFTKTYGISAVDMKWFWNVNAMQSDKRIIRDAWVNAWNEARGQWCLYCGSDGLERYDITDNGAFESDEYHHYECLNCGEWQP